MAKQPVSLLVLVLDVVSGEDLMLVHSSAAAANPLRIAACILET